MDDTVTTLVTRAANSEVSTWLSTALPLLALRCQAAHFDVLIHADTSFDLDTILDEEVFVQARWGQEQAGVIRMNLVGSTNEIAAFKDPIDILRQLVSHDQMTFGFKPFNANEVATTFNLTGLRNVIQPLLAACGISPVGIGISST